MTLSSRDVSPVTGLSTQETVTGTATTLASGNYVTVLEILNTQNVLWITGASFTYSVGPDPSGPTYRFKAKLSSQDDYKHLAPYDVAGQDVVEGREDAFRTPIQIPRGGSVKVEVGTASVSGGTKVTAELTVVRFKP